MSIDDLLSQPLPAVADNGFSARVIARVTLQYRRRVALIATGSAAAASALCLVVPMPALSIELNRVLVDLATSPAVALGAAALVVTFLVDRRVFNL